MNRKMIQMLLIVFLLVLFIVRCVINQPDNDWVRIVDYFCVLIAIVDLYIKLRLRSSKQKGFPIVTVITSIILVMLIIIGALVFTNILLISSKTSDILTIIVLLISLPSDFYCEIINKLLD